MDLLDTSLPEKTLNPRQSELEMNDVIMNGGGFANPEGQDSNVNKTAQEVQQEVINPNPSHTSMENMCILDESSDYLFLETSRSNALGDGFVTLNVISVEPKEIVGDENMDILDESSEYSFFKKPRSNALGDGLEIPNVKTVEPKKTMGGENNERTLAETRTPASELSGLEKVEELCNGMALQSDSKSLSPVQEDAASKTTLEDSRATVLTIDDNRGAAPPLDAIGNLDVKQSEPVKKAVNITAEVGLDGAKPVQSRKGKPKLVSQENTRVLRSRTQEKDNNPEPKAMGIENSANEIMKGKRRKKKVMKNLPVNEFSRIRKHLKYLLKRINFEQILIDAYSGEGWKGQSLEKIKPEKELQRARSQIFCCKLKIRELFRRLDASFSEGKLPESFFDSEGEIDSDDIFCAKCGSKDVTLDNDIILCDGVCDRGFHQFCLETPLLKEDIPAGDEGWLCPGCDCKDDCLDMLNDFQGSRFSILDNWEKVFPEEAAASASGKNMDDISNLHSEDSEDDDYNPDNQQPSHNDSGDENSAKSEDFNVSDDDMLPAQNDGGLLELPSDDSEDDDFDPSAPPSDDQPAEHESSSSDFTSDSEDLGAVLKENCADKDRGLLELPSDDSEDDDFDPSAPRDDQPADHESSSSDFTSDSEDLGAVLKENCADKDEGCMSSLSNYTKHDASAGKEKPTVGKVKGHSLRDELSYLLDSNAASISGKRHVERLDYKMLHDETYGDATSDSSDEEYGQKMGKKRRNDSDGMAVRGPVSCKRARKCQADDRVGNVCLKGAEQAFNVEEHTSSETQGLNNACAKAEASSGAGSSGKNRGFGEPVLQRLLESFKENQYPKNDVKESLARELGIRVKQVAKWFENARWSFRHKSRMESKFSKISGANSASSAELKESTPKPKPTTVSTTPSCNGVEEKRQMQSSPGKECPPKDMEEGQSVTLASGQNSRSRVLKSSKENMGNQLGSNASTSEPTPNQKMPVDTRKSQPVRKSTRLRSISSS